MRRSYAVLPLIAVLAASATVGTTAHALPIVNGGRETQPAKSAAIPAEWQNVCRERLFVRKDWKKRTFFLLAPVCTSVWISRRFFSNGRYFADPDFTIPIN